MSLAPTEEAIHCPLCDYDLRGLIEPRCPECGYRFDWKDLRDPTRRLHPYLFEHHPERNIRALLRTVRASQRPKRFWRGLFPTQRPDRRRLLIYWLVPVLLLAVLPFLICFGIATYQIDRNSRYGRSSSVFSSPPPTAADIDRWFPVLPDPRVLANALVCHFMEPTTLTACWIIGWPWLTLASLMVFQASMRRAQIRPIHVLRCVIYSADGMLWLGVLLAAVAVYALPLDRVALLYPKSAYRPPDFPKLLLLPAAAVLTYRLWVAYAVYLRFRHALATVIASQVMVLLIMWKFGLDMDLIGW